jgi:hypothetical protein
MALALIIFIISFLVLAGMLGMGMYKLRQGKSSAFFSETHRAEIFLRNKLSGLRYRARFLNKKTISLLFHAVLDRIEGKLVKGRDFLYALFKRALKKVQAAKRPHKPQDGESGKVSDFIQNLKDK